MNLLALRKRVFLAMLGLVPLTLAPALVVAQTAGPASHIQHVLLISVDGLHQTDLAWYVQHHPQSALAYLVSHGADFANAQTPVPSDSFPGMVAQVTGGNPKTTGVYYDDTWNHALLPAGTTQAQCMSHSVAPGVEVTYFEQLDKNPLALDAGQGLKGLPWSILNMTGTPQGVQSLIDPTQLPVDPNTCKPVYPHEYLRVNTIFEVARKAGLRTAWSDKHIAYEILSGPTWNGIQGGTSIQDLFAPEINSNASVVNGQDWTKDNASTQIYDSFKVQAVLNEIDGLDHSGQHRVGVPAIFGMNFQTVSTAEKLPNGGYMADGVTPSALLAGALDYINAKIGAMLAELGLNDTRSPNSTANTNNTANLHNTVVILSAKHGQSPDDPNKLTRIKDSKIIKDLNAAWVKAGHTGDLVAFSVDDDGMYMWLNDRRQTAADFAKTFLLGYNGKGDGSDGMATATDIQGNPKAYTSAGLDPNKIYAGKDAAAFFEIPATDKVGNDRVPDLVGVTQVGTVYTGGTGKIAEHGGDNPQDRHVALVVAGGNVDHSVSGNSVETTQIAPTILHLLGLDPNSLQAVQKEHTQVLPVGQ